MKTLRTVFINLQYRFRVEKVREIWFTLQIGITSGDTNAADSDASREFRILKSGKESEK